jgi:hypothetical protein
LVEFLTDIYHISTKVKNEWKYFNLFSQYLLVLEKINEKQVLFSGIIPDFQGISYKPDSEMRDN